MWRKAGIGVPPCFIIVCQNTAVSKLVYDYVSGFQREQEDGTSTLEHGRLPFFRNYGRDHRQPLAPPEHTAHRFRATRSGRCSRKGLPGDGCG